MIKSIVYIYCVKFTQRLKSWYFFCNNYCNYLLYESVFEARINLIKRKTYSLVTESFFLLFEQLSYQIDTDSLIWIVSFEVARSHHCNSRSLFIAFPFRQLYQLLLESFPFLLRNHISRYLPCWFSLKARKKLCNKSKTTTKRFN